MIDSGLDNDCGLIAAAAWKFLDDRGVPARILNVRYGRREGHCIVAFFVNSRLCTYDADGTMVYTTAEANLDTNPTTIARAWAKAAGITKKVIQGKWHGPARSPDADGE